MQMFYWFWELYLWWNLSIILLLFVTKCWVQLWNIFERFDFPKCKGFVEVCMCPQCIGCGGGLSRGLWISCNDTFPLYSGIYNVTTRIYTFYEIPENYSYLQWTSECVLWEEEKCSSCLEPRSSLWQFLRSSLQTECGDTIQCLVFLGENTRLYHSSIKARFKAWCDLKPLRYSPCPFVLHRVSILSCP